MRRDDDDELFERRLKADADSSMPAFSAALHDRVLGRVRTAARDAEARHAPLRLWVGRLSIATAAVVAIGVTGWLFDPGLAPEPQSPQGLPMIASIASFDVVADSTRAVDSKMNDARYGYLDQDVKAFAAFVRETMPSTPFPDGG